jgi:DUF4097 and DUF4098 domain-containing protein YvlB
MHGFRIFAVVFGLFGTGALALASSAHSESFRSCEDRNIQFSDRGARKAETEIRIPKSAASALEISPSENGGIWLQGSDREDFLVTLCKAVPDDEDSEKALAEIQIVRTGNRVSVQGPASDEWVGHLIVHAPKNASVDLHSHNGPVSVRGFEGHATIDSENGPVSLRESSGQIDVRTQNGPIHFEGGSGKVRLEADNGPLSVRLPSGSWKNGDLEGRTQNGPLHVDLVRDYVSGVRVTTAGRSPVHCGAEACRQARRNWDDESKTIEFGPENALVRLSTENGPVSISEKD